MVKIKDSKLKSDREKKIKAFVGGAPDAKDKDSKRFSVSLSNEAYELLQQVACSESRALSRQAEHLILSGIGYRHRIQATNQKESK